MICRHASAMLSTRGNTGKTSTTYVILVQLSLDTCNIVQINKTRSAENHFKLLLLNYLSLNNYRPKRSFGQGNIFTSVCLSRGGCVVSNFSGGSPTGIRSTFGRYASYWNAFLLFIQFCARLSWCCVNRLSPLMKKHSRFCVSFYRHWTGRGDLI